MYTVYIHQNKENGKRYVGITSREPRTRWKRGFGYSDQLPIGRAFRKYGWGGFSHQIIATDLTEDDAKEMEIRLIAEYQTQNPTFGYNITIGGDGVTGWHPSEETRRKIGKAQRGKYGEANSNYGHHWTDEMKAEASRHKKGNMSAETRQKLSDAAKLRTGNRNPFYGKTHSTVAKEKISQAQSVPVKMFTKDMTFLREYPSMRKAADDTGINKVSISNCCRGVSKSAGGYIWQYA